MGLRQERLADEVRDVLAECFLGGKMSDPRLESVTITAVKISADLQLAYVYYRVYGDDKGEQAQKGLESAAGYLKKKLAKSLDVRRVPELKFFFDESIEHASRIEELLKKL
ncbi:30S ribosome-binding factor RbfA [Pseudobacteriovorax antillogorgiicola]|uniref:Ribosome-binding factor A n=1 Tax=Pseudobacteriovorax antillogorgiicola TaxID=1513793 RepID=A0A1Y6B2X8_9BACT|nr:30S ribosome-binding factor RbfA [Pseudobacteriovorax antillogorgiicola]TCS59395.1 ribosome-binding factor A [Pseudobacteriovorax antillogorgiicola]SME88682.1 ribosome-binding factor A [Pseudobacteriovorax antillogorgiicola]